ncbi:transposase [Embleya sp. NPDC005575]|uniref:transposase n=1 Tax=Embleya sp. NPDC005575 TaxID=3156892 RepID=UPI0033A855F7
MLSASAVTGERGVAGVYVDPAGEAESEASMRSASKYTDEFKREAVARFHATIGVRTFASVAAELGINHETLRGWVRLAEATDGHDDPAGSPVDRAELDRLRHQVSLLERERDLLRRAAQYFARELPS